MSKTISLDAFRKKKEQEESKYQSEPIWGTLVWLYCPACDKLEYTEIRAPNGRSHKCGTQVQEREVELDLRGELTLTQANLLRIDHLLAEASKNRLKKLLARSMENTLKMLKTSELTYAERLSMAAGGFLEPYPEPLEDIAERLPIAETNALGLFISPFRLNPEERFDLKGPSTPEPQ
ncbi:MAG: hypothetical protein RRB13_04370 [bacterium]|nr:hypothetical protein [bacterium]